MIWMGKGIRRGTTLKSVDAIDLAPTLLHMLGYGTPAHCSGRILEEILDR